MSANVREYVRVEGAVVKSERNAGNFVGSDGGAVAYDYIEVKVLSDEYDVASVRFPSDGTVPVPANGDRVSIRCSVVRAGANVKVTAIGVDSGTYLDHAALTRA